MPVVPRVFDDLATIPPSRFLQEATHRIDFFGPAVPALNANGVIAGVAPPPPRVVTETLQPASSTEPPPPPAEREQPAHIVTSGFQTRRGAFVELNDGLRVFSTKYVQTATTGQVYFEFTIAGEDQLVPIDGITPANVEAAMASIMPKFSPGAHQKKHFALFEGTVGR